MIQFPKKIKGRTKYLIGGRIKSNVTVHCRGGGQSHGGRGEHGSYESASSLHLSSSQTYKALSISLRERSRQAKNAKLGTKMGEIRRASPDLVHYNYFCLLRFVSHLFQSTLVMCFYSSVLPNLMEFNLIFSSVDMGQKIHLMGETNVLHWAYA